MNNYELTERGKIVIAVILVIILLVIPAIVILAMSSCSDTSSSGREGASSEPAGTSPVIAGTPEQPPSDDATGTTDPDSPPAETPQPTEDTAIDPTPGTEEDGIGQASIEQGPIELDLAQGTMAFIFALDSEVGLGAETTEMVGEFLSSPKNASNTLIQVNMPQLGADDEKVFLAAVSDAFAEYDITEDDILFVKSNADVTERAIEVSLSFTPISSNRK